MMAFTTFVAAVLLAATATAAPSADTLAVCDAIYDQYGNVIYDPLGPDGSRTFNQLSTYQDILTDYWNGDNAENRPACMFLPSNASQVSFAVKQLNKYSSVRYALKSGGHNPNKGFSSVDQGVLISFRPNLNSTTISADRQTADVGPGSRWSEAVNVLDPYGKTIVGGRLGHVGVGGYVLGGGLSFLTAEYGFACDTIVNFEIVLADGTIANANATSEPDLFYALKGGGNQFGIVTKYTFRTVPMGMVWGGTRIYDGASTHKALLSATSNFTRESRDPKAAVIVTFDYSLADLVNLVVVFYFYNGPAPPAGILDEYLNISYLIDNTKNQSYPSLLSANSQFSLQGLNYQIGEATYPNLKHDDMVAFYEHYWTTYANFTVQQSLTNLDMQILSFAIQPLPANLKKASNDAGGNRLGLDPSHGDSIFMEHDISWLNSACDTECPKRLAGLIGDLKAWQKSNYGGQAPTNYQSGDIDFVSYNPIFMNDGQNGQKVLQSYGNDTYARMKQIQVNRDPKGFFSQRQDGFKFDT